MAAWPISFAEMDAYCRIHRLALHSWQIDLIRALDAEYMSVLAEHNEEESSKEKAKKDAEQKKKR